MSPGDQNTFTFILEQTRLDNKSHVYPSISCLDKPRRGVPSTGKLVENATTHLADVKMRETLDLVITQGE